MLRRLWLVAVLLIAGPAVVSAEHGEADLAGTAEDSAVAGTAVLTDTPQGLKVVVTIRQAPPGTHGLHIHQYGRCGDGGKAAGSHYNPDGVKHGFLMADGLRSAHAGDLGNIEIGADGSGILELTVPNVTLSGSRYSVGGRAVILHEWPDDFSQPTGNAGGRIACGPILLMEPGS
ncbi:MAG: superoxide dismutase family protein [Candidatus Omnitrophica bacterium]|nr:superoxide dismutase family protein [Candidatus Omnitrophota bacterium]